MADVLASGVAGSLVTRDVRRHNLSMILACLSEHGALSRSRLAELTGLTRGSVTALVRVLMREGLVAEVPGDASRPAGGRAGRPRVMIRITADTLAVCVLQIDAGGVTGVVAALDGRELVRVVQGHGRPLGDPAPVLDVAAVVLGQVLADAQQLGRTVRDLTYVVFAPVGGRPARVLADTDLGWGEVDVVAGIAARVSGLPVMPRLVSDVPVAVQAEVHAAGAGAADVLYVKSDSGIGGALLSGGRLLEGAHGMAGGTVGHIPVDFDGAPCLCGQRGCLVTVAGPDVILDAAGLSGLVQREGLAVGVGELVNRVRAGDAAACHAWEAAARWIVRAVRILVVAFDPAVVLVGGYWAGLVDTIITEWDRQRPAEPLLAGWADPQILAGPLGRDAAITGAVRAARDRLLQDPYTL